ncbi:MAG: hypothetical protein ABSD56_15915 [Bryobacteraceae bacterium]
MDPTARDIALVLIGFLPLTLGGWVLLMVFAGLLKDERDQPAWYRWLAPILLRRGRPTPSLNGAGMTVFLLGVLNLCPVLILVDAVVRGIPFQILAVVLAYLLVEAVLVVQLFRGVLAAWRRGRQ